MGSCSRLYSPRNSFGACALFKADSRCSNISEIKVATSRNVRFSFCFVWPTGLINVYARAISHGSRWCEGPGHHGKPRSNGGVLINFVTKK